MMNSIQEYALEQGQPEHIPLSVTQNILWIEKRNWKEHTYKQQVAQNIRNTLARIHVDTRL